MRMGAPALISTIGGTVSGRVTGVLLELLVLDLITAQRAMVEPNPLLTYIVVIVNVLTFMTLDWFSEEPYQDID